jgi:hypothetical protein
MKLATLLLASLSLFAQTAPKSNIDKAAVEAYLRHAELWVPQVSVKIADPKPSAYLPGFSELAVHLSYNGQAKDEHYYISQDGKSHREGRRL